MTTESSRCDTFVSYNTADKPSVEHLAERLESAGVTYWLASKELIAGVPWLDGVATGIEDADSVIVCIGPEGLGKWQWVEVRLAVDLAVRKNGFKVIPVLLPGVRSGNLEELEVPAILQTFHAVDFRNGLNHPPAWEALMRALGRPVAGPAASAGKRQSVIANRRAVSVALIHGGKVLLVKRSARATTGAGMWQFPGGKVREGEPKVDAAVREAKEETGYVIRAQDLIEIGEVADPWLDKPSGRTLAMTLFWCTVDHDAPLIADEFEEHVWEPLSDIFGRARRVYFGATNQMLRLLRRYFLLYRPLSELADCIENGGGGPHVDLPLALDGLTPQATQVLYSTLGLLGFLDDRGRFAPSSILSGSIIRNLAGWAQTTRHVFEPQGEGTWSQEVIKRGGRREIERYRQGMFEEHEAFLGLLSHRLPKALSVRYVCDVLIAARDEASQRLHLLLRWDCLAGKFQIPAKGLEEYDGTFDDEGAARYIVADRVDPQIADLFRYERDGTIETAHVSAGSLDDGPLMRKYYVSVFRAAPAGEGGESLFRLLGEINAATEMELKTADELSTARRRRLRYYVWADLETVLANRFELLDRKLQGVDEIIENLGKDVFERLQPVGVLSHGGAVPVIDSKNARPMSGLQFVMTRFDPASVPAQAAAREGNQ